MAIKLICLDLDGTLLGPDKRVSGGCREALAEARAAGACLAIASGRHPFNVTELMAELDLPLTAVCLSGAWTVLDGREVARHALKALQVAGIIDVAEACGAYVSLAGSDFNLICGEPEWGQPATGSFLRYTRAGTYTGLRRLAGEKGPLILKAALHASNDEEYARVRELFSGLEGVEVAQSDVRWVDVTDAGCSKAEGISALACALGIGMDEVAAVGDDENDLDSLAAVGLGIAMGNALPAAKERARAVVADNVHDGAAEAIRLALAWPGTPTEDAS